jgi:hypothetical protein
MDKQKLVDSIAYCGLVCGMCHLSAECDFCRNTARLCARSTVCYQRDCCIDRGLHGCWECTEFPCGEDMHGPPHDLKIRAFAAFIRAEGCEAFIDCLLRNQASGIHYGLGKDYDGMRSEEEVIRLLRTGLLPP